MAETIATIIDTPTETLPVRVVFIRGDQVLAVRPVESRLIAERVIEKLLPLLQEPGEDSS